MNIQNNQNPYQLVIDNFQLSPSDEEIKNNILQLYKEHPDSPEVIKTVSELQIPTENRMPVEERGYIQQYLAAAINQTAQHVLKQMHLAQLPEHVRAFETTATLDDQEMLKEKLPTILRELHSHPLATRAALELTRSVDFARYKAFQTLNPQIALYNAFASNPLFTHQLPDFCKMMAESPQATPPQRQYCFQKLSEETQRELLQKQEVVNLCASPIFDRLALDYPGYQEGMHPHDTAANNIRQEALYRGAISLHEKIMPFIKAMKIVQNLFNNESYQKLTNK